MCAPFKCNLFVTSVQHTSPSLHFEYMDICDVFLTVLQISVSSPLRPPIPVLPSRAAGGEGPYHDAPERSKKWPCEQDLETILPKVYSITCCWNAGAALHTLPTATRKKSIDLGQNLGVQSTDKAQSAREGAHHHRFACTGGLRVPDGERSGREGVHLHRSCRSRPGPSPQAD